MEGFLSRKKFQLKWHKYWCACQGTELAFYGDKKRKRREGYIDLLRVHQVRSEAPIHPLQFVVNTNSDLITLRAETPELCELWVEKLRAAKARSAAMQSVVVPGSPSMEDRDSGLLFDQEEGAAGGKQQQLAAEEMSENFSNTEQLNTASRLLTDTTDSVSSADGSQEELQGKKTLTSADLGGDSSDSSPGYASDYKNIPPEPKTKQEAKLKATVSISSEVSEVQMRRKSNSSANDDSAYLTGYTDAGEELEKTDVAADGCGLAEKTAALAAESPECEPMKEPESANCAL